MTHCETIQYTGASAQVFTFDNGSDVCEYHVMLSASESPHFTTQLQAILDAYDALRQTHFPRAVAVFKRYFLSDAANQSDLLLANVIESDDCALSIVQQPPLDGTKVALWAYLQTGVQTRLGAHGLYEVTHAPYTHLWSGTATALADTSANQTTLLLNQYVLQLFHADCTLADNCMRTWFFVNDIDNHYAGVVTARNQVFLEQNLTKNTHFIASTGIGGRQADSRLLTMLDTYAVRGIAPTQVQQLYAPTHLNRTSDYGVSFERGTAVHYGDRSHVFISGTASIDRNGAICHVGDVLAQTKRMWENVEALLNEANCSFDDVAQLIVYLRDTADYRSVKALFDARFPAIPSVFVLAPVCRPGWLIEMECMAIKAADNPQFPNF